MPNTDQSSRPEAITALLSNLRSVTRQNCSVFLEAEPAEMRAIARALKKEKNDRIDGYCLGDALYWLQNHTMTDNPQYQSQGLPFRAPFPKKPYFKPLFEAFTAHPRLFIPKSRELMTTWAVCGFSAHRAQFYKEETILQTLTEDKAAEAVDYVRQLYDNQDYELQKRHPLKKKGVYEIEWQDGGRFMGIPSGADAIRSAHPTRFVLDEAAHVPGAQESWDAAHPVCPWMIAISTAASSWFGDECQGEYAVNP